MSITVFIPNYNHGNHLQHSLSSVLSQSLQPKEILLFDDASTDNSLEVIKEYQEKYPVIRFIQNKENLGVEKTQELALEIAQGDYFVSLGADDILLPDFLKECHEVLEANPEIGYCCGQQFRFLDTPSPFTVVTTLHYICEEEPYKVFTPKEAFKVLTRSIFCPGTTSILYRTCCINECGGFRKELAGLADWYLNFQIPLKYGFAHIPKPFGASRAAEQCYSSSINTQADLREKYYDVLIDIIQKEGKEWEKKFIGSGLFFHIGNYIYPYIMKNRKHWKYLPRLIQKKMIVSVSNRTKPHTSYTADPFEGTLEIADISFR